MDSPGLQHHRLPVANASLQQPDDATATTTPTTQLADTPTNFDPDNDNSNNDNDNENDSDSDDNSGSSESTSEEQAASQPPTPPPPPPPAAAEEAPIGSVINHQQQQPSQPQPPQLYHHHVLPTATNNNNNAFVRPPRPGEPVNTMFAPPPQQTIPQKRPLSAVSGVGAGGDAVSKKNNTNNNNNNNNGQFGGGAVPPPAPPPPRPGQQQQQQDGSNSNISGNVNSQATTTTQQDQSQSGGAQSQSLNNNSSNNNNNNGSNDSNTFESGENNNNDINIYNTQLQMLHALQQRQQQQHNSVQQLPPRHPGLPLPLPPPPPAVAPGDSAAGSGGSNDNDDDNDKSEGGSHFRGMKLIPNPPDLQAWRERLFNVDETIVLTEEQFQTYFPHVDNVYSHRSTQRYKRKPFISHYWDCRLKGRPPGTPKSDDPNKKKRHRTARQRDLCDVKIKITEYFPGAVPEVHVAGSGPGAQQQPSSELPPGVNPNNNNNGFFNPGAGAAVPRGGAGGGGENLNQQFGMLAPNPALLPTGLHPAPSGAKYYTIQRVNGSGGNGKADGVGGGHRHTLEESDRIKKNSVQRFLLKQEKERKKALAQQKTYHKKATGLAAWTVKKHSKECDLKLYGSCFCPFAQRVWIALELKGLPYQYIEVDPYKKPESLLEMNPRGLVPVLRHGNWSCYESTVLLEYLEDLNMGRPLLPPGDPKLRAHCRVWADHINRHIVPGFYRVLQEQDAEKQAANAQELKDNINKLVNAAHVQGPFFLGPTITFVDVHIAPWILRLRRVLKPYRGWPDPEPGSRWAAWVDAIEASEHIKATTSGDELYLDSYERYAENRPGTSQLATAINAGRPLP